MCVVGGALTCLGVWGQPIRRPRCRAGRGGGGRGRPAFRAGGAEASATRVIFRKLWGPVLGAGPGAAGRRGG